LNHPIHGKIWRLKDKMGGFMGNLTGKISNVFKNIFHRKKKENGNKDSINNLVQHHISQSSKSKIYASLVLTQLHSLKTQTHNSFNLIS
jgi:hypothetical protein